MRLSARFCLCAVLVLVSWMAIPAVAQGASGSDAGYQGGPAVMCQETYALCIIAPCKKVPIIDPNGTITWRGICECDVITDSESSPAWSQGPGDCASREPQEGPDGTILISTYSNLYNEEYGIATCDEAIEWAWCYGAQCVVDPENPGIAICNCPLQNTTANILGDCADDLCGEGLYSAARPGDDCWANCNYQKQMEAMGLPSNPPADGCSGGAVCDCSQYGG